MPPRVGPPSTPVTDLEGVDPAGNPLTVPVGDGPGRTLLLFLSADCDGCGPFWPAVADTGSLGLVAGERAVVVARDPTAEDLDALAGLAVPGTTVVLSGGAWAAYGVQGPPFFALVEPVVGRVVTEGVAWAVPQVAAAVARVPRTGREE
ncbi:MAG: hypothetical protein ACRDWN_05015 [Acidimicrobiales bacterium]